MCRNVLSLSIRNQEVISAKEQSSPIHVIYMSNAQFLSEVPQHNGSCIRMLAFESVPEGEEDKCKGGEGKALTVDWHPLSVGTVQFLEPNWPYRARSHTFIAIPRPAMSSDSTSPHLVMRLQLPVPGNTDEQDWLCRPTPARLGVKLGS